VFIFIWVRFIQVFLGYTLEKTLEQGECPAFVAAKVELAAQSTLVDYPEFFSSLVQFIRTRAVSASRTFFSNTLKEQCIWRASDNRKRERVLEWFIAFSCQSVFVIWKWHRFISSTKKKFVQENISNSLVATTIELMVNIAGQSPHISE
jgi:hypothetical protein